MLKMVQRKHLLSLQNVIVLVLTEIICWHKLDLVTYTAIGKSNTVVSAYTVYRHLQQYCSHPWNGKSIVAEKCATACNIRKKY